MRVSRFEVLLALAALSSGCSFLFNFDGYAGGSDVSMDGSVDSPDASLDGSPNDATTIDAADVSVETGTFCQSQWPMPPDGSTSFFCADYDEPDSAPNSPETFCTGCDAGGPSVTVQPDDDSPPNALVITIPALLDTSADAWAYDLVQSVGGSVVQMAFDLKTDTYLPMTFWLFSVNDLSVWMYLATDTLWLMETSAEDGGTTYQDKITSSADIMHWHRYSLAYDMSLQSVTVGIDGMTVTMGAHYVDWGMVDFQIGVESAQGPLPITHYQFDNVVLWTLE